MRFECRMNAFTSDCANAGRQMDDAFGSAFVRLAEDAFPSLPGMSSLVIFLSMMSPKFRLPPDNSRGSYHKATDTYFSTARVEYDGWTDEGWAGRVRSYADAVRRAVGRITKTRILDSERQRLLDIVEQAERETMGAPPPYIEPLRPELVPDMAIPTSPPLDCPPMVKLYRREDEGLSYHEAWGGEGTITEHWGVCGEEGESRLHRYSSFAEAKNIMTSIETDARSRGYRPLAPSRHRQLVVELPFTDCCSIETRHKIEDLLDNRLGWLGLGHCDGGSAGSGTMEIFCIVVDLGLAMTAVRKALEPLNLGAEPHLFEMKRR